MVNLQVCPQLQSKGACGDESCAFNHDVRICEDCDVLCTSAASYRSHLGGKKHRSKVLGLSTLLQCPLCNVQVYGPITWEQHVAGGPHQREAIRQGVSANVEPVGPEEIQGKVFCALCDTHIPQHQWSKHLQGAMHRKKERLTAYKTALEEAEKDKHGVTVTEGLDLGIVSIKDAQGGVSVTFKTETTVPASRVAIIDTKLSSALVPNSASP